jgi:hypothetical protein
LAAHGPVVDRGRVEGPDRIEDLDLSSRIASASNVAGGSMAVRVEAA